MDNLKSAEAAGDLVGRTSQTIRNWYRDGRLPAASVSPLRFWQADVEAAARSAARPGPKRREDASDESYQLLRQEEAALWLRGHAVWVRRWLGKLPMVDAEARRVLDWHLRQHDEFAELPPGDLRMPDTERLRELLSAWPSRDGSDPRVLVAFVGPRREVGPYLFPLPPGDEWTNPSTQDRLRQAAEVHRRRLGLQPFARIAKEEHLPEPTAKRREALWREVYGSHGLLFRQFDDTYIPDDDLLRRQATDLARLIDSVHPGRGAKRLGGGDDDAER